ncbi:hypothetical protein AGMMS49546_01650 [Spirochaetia bacterium]|nr:hypothetical protein AGMMS49546_01650 [Spirochaetia bacterium]
MGDRFHRHKGAAVLKAAQKKEPVFAHIRIGVDKETPAGRGHRVRSRERAIQAAARTSAESGVLFFWFGA